MYIWQFVSLAERWAYTFELLLDTGSAIPHCMQHFLLPCFYAKLG